jgi:hypothetical protein
VTSIAIQLGRKPALAAVLLLPLFMLVGVAAFSIPERYAKSVVAIPMLFIVGLLWTSAIATESFDQTWLRKLFVIAFVFHVGIALGLEIVWPSFEQRSDAQLYNLLGRRLANFWAGEGRTIDWNTVSAPGYIYVNAVVYSLFGYTPLLMKLLNCLFGSMAVIYTIRLSEQLFDKQIARIAGILTLALPSISFWTAQNLKDGSVLLLSMMALWSAIQTNKRPHIHLPLLLAAISALISIRRETGVGIALVIAATYILQHAHSSLPKLLTGGAVVLALGWVLSAGGYGFLGSEYVQERFSIERINQQRTGAAYGGSAIEEGGDYGSLGELAVGLPADISNFLLRPWPWEATGSLDQLMTIPESLIWYPLFALAMIGLFQTIVGKRRQAILIWVYALAATVAAAPQYGNLGTAYRHRVQVWPCYLILAAVGWAWLKAHREQAAQR